MSTPSHPDKDDGSPIRKAPSRQIVLVAIVIVALLVALIAVHVVGA